MRSRSRTAGALDHGVRGLPTATASAVDAGRGDERGRLRGVGAHAGRVRAPVLAADVAQLGLDDTTVAVRSSAAVGRGGDVLVVPESTGVDHHRPEPGRRGQPREGEVLDVVEVQGDRDAGGLGEG